MGRKPESSFQSAVSENREEREVQTMTVNGHGWMGAACALLLLPGCISQRAQQIELDVTALQDSLRIVYARQDALYERILEMDERSEEQDIDLDEIRAEHRADVADLRSQLSTTGTNLGQTEERVASLTQRFDTLDRRVEGVQTQAPGDTTRPASAAGMTQSYDRAYLDFSKGNYELAILGFSEYLKDYPRTERADNAQYWIGECYYVQGNYEPAIEAFQKVLDLHADGNKAPGAMLKIGYALIGLNRKSAAIRQLKTVMERYPGTPEAEHARAKLLSI